METKYEVINLLVENTKSRPQRFNCLFYTFPKIGALDPNASNIKIMDKSLIHCPKT